MILLRIIYEILNNELFFNEFFIHILGFAIDFFFKKLSMSHEEWRTFQTCVTAVGLRAGNTRYTFVTAGVGLAVVRGGSSWHSVRYGDEYYFSTFVGRARTNLTGRWRALFARYF